MSDPWFGPKRYGYGLTPRNWKGWAATVVFLAVALAFTVFAIARRWPPLLMLAALIGLCLVFAVLATLKSEANSWRWRWGDD